MLNKHFTKLTEVVKPRRLTIAQLTCCAASVALGTILSYIKLFSFPMGGSVTLLSMVVICLPGYWFGLSAGLVTGIAYGVLQLIIDPYIISLPQMLIDYVFAFGALGLSGLFSKSKHSLIKGYVLGVLGRYLFSFLSGWIFFATYTPEFFNSAAIYSLAYNGAYLGAEALITLILISLPPVNRALSQVKKAAVN